ncbi:XdhC family protein [Halorubrum halophilum]|uniref:XdhC family protein n=1 Tax=Halorubrum halophilum TaxID=413816 RepID=UPI000679CF74|nr:XdhC/CoxI family protein [Halorubrum halophilum]
MTAGDWSVPETEVMDAVDEGLDEQNAVLATVVAVEGSAYRRPGAKMVVVDDGNGVGSITAGCLEDEVLTLAAEVLDVGEPRIKQFDLTGDDDVWGLGVGCNGVIDILLEPLDDRYRPVVDAYQRGEDTAVLTVLTSDNSRLDVGDRALGFSTATSDDPDLRFETTEWPEWVIEEVSPTAELLISRDKSDSVALERNGETVEVFVDSVTAPPELIVFGSGHDVAPVASLAKQVDFRVTVASFRGGAAEGDRFPAADRVVSTSPAATRETLAFDENTYAVVMTHNFIDDRIVLEELLETPLEYIGLMGPRKRFEEMQEEFHEEGRTFGERELERVYTPAGLDLGGGTPFHIAQSIVAELTAIHHDRDPKHLKEREGTIHRRVEIDS